MWVFSDEWTNFLCSVFNGNKWLCEGSWIKESSTPAHTFTNVVFVAPNDTVGIIVSRDSFSSDLCLTVIDFLRRSGFDNDLDFNGICGLDCADSGFDCVGVASPPAHQHFKAQHDELHSKTVWAFPFYRCEFSGLENAATIERMTGTSRLVTVVDWARPPQPKLLIQYSIPGVTKGSGEDGLGLTDAKTLEWVISELETADLGWVEVMNFREQAVQISREKGRFKILDTGNTLIAADFSKHTVSNWVDVFLRKGIE